MKSPRNIGSAFALMLLLLPGCIFNGAVSERSELRSGGAGPIRVYTTDSSLYMLKTYALETDHLTGSGIRRAYGFDSAFSGSIPLNTIAYINAKESDFWKTTLSLFMIGFIGGYASEAFASREMMIYYRGSGSCPSIYSDNGLDLAYEGDAISTAFGKGLESETFTLLSSIGPATDRVKIRVVNERRETHYLNTVSVVAYSADTAASVVLAADGTAWPVYRPMAPASGTDLSGRDIVKIIAQPDGSIWRSDLFGAMPESDYRDVVRTSFPAGEAGGEYATLVFTGSNTSLPLDAIGNTLEFLGDESLAFYRSAETNPRTIADLKHWLRECSMRVEYRSNDVWRFAGEILPEANGPLFTRAVRLGPIPPGIDTLFVRLSCLSDTWTIDRIAIDWYDGGQCPQVSAGAWTALSDDTTETAASLRTPDDAYSILLPGSYIDMESERLERIPGRRWWYALRVGGYLHEWIPSSVPDAAGESIFGRIPGANLQTVEYLLGRKDVLLPALYAYWNTVRSQASPEGSTRPASSTGTDGSR